MKVEGRFYELFKVKYNENSEKLVFEDELEYEVSPLLREKNITKVLLALDYTEEVIKEAKEIGAELILTHHPLLFRKPSTITTDTLLG
ncbi:Nif3-like dinuclear metal center hexameric protein, partial [Clostridium perfringens]|uniref:Nif3-like dinuclear metal center hexameric protein n=1 Tax=Clostridium perfringens TaxID=1502 RepID=UPI003F4255DB